jgi:signal transduction histidine kinase
MMRTIVAFVRLRLRSAGLSFSLAYGLLYALSSALFLSFLWWRTTGLMERQVEQAVDADYHALAEHWVQDGLPGLVLAIQDRLEQNVDDDAIYLLVAPDGRKIEGNLVSWPRNVTRTDVNYERAILRDGVKATSLLHAYDLPGGCRMIVGRDIRGRAILRPLLADTLVWSWVMVTLLAVGGALVVRGIFKRIVSSIARTTAAITHGDMAQRVPLMGNEVDLVAVVVNEMLDRIVRLMDGVRQVSNAIAHDLRTPISRARAQLEDAALNCHTTDELRGAIERAVSDLDHVTAVFEALMRIAQIEAGARRAAFETFDLATVLTDIGELYSAAAEDAHLTLTTALPGEQQFYGDQRMIQQAVANMLDNAIKFSPQASTITLSCAVDSKSAPQRRVTIAVSDEGIGMNESDLARASERFFRAETARNTPGAGLGLSLVQAIAQLHGGHLELSRRNPGLRVALVLPLATKPPPRTDRNSMTQDSSASHLSATPVLVSGSA